MANENKQYMIAAIKQVKDRVADNVGGPFGACIVLKDQVISLGHNTVLEDVDPTCHAEINAIRTAAEKLGRYDLKGCVIYSTTEPCPMCFSAIHWANIDKIVYGTEIDDVKKLGFRELNIDNHTLKKLGNSNIEIVSGFEREACKEMLEYWQEHSKLKTY